jgi:hypothetical protein
VGIECLVLAKLIAGADTLSKNADVNGEFGAAFKFLDALLLSSAILFLLEWVVHISLLLTNLEDRRDTVDNDWLVLFFLVFEMFARDLLEVD